MDGMHAGPLTYLLIGNPGVGKSTILNGLLCKPVFKSGVSFGSGLTYRLDTYTDEATGCTFADTPGLADTEKRTQAAAAITKALKAGGRFRIFFVITLEQGRVKPEDVATMKLVLDAAPIRSYGIIINQANRKEYSELMENPSNRSPSPMDMVLQQLLARLRPEQRSLMLHIVHRDPDLDGADDVAKPLPQHLMLFMRSLPFSQFTPEEVTKVREDEFEQEREESQKRMAELVAAKESLEVALKMNKDQMTMLQQQADAHQRAMGDLQTKMEQQAREHREEMKEITRDYENRREADLRELRSDREKHDKEHKERMAELKKSQENGQWFAGAMSVVSAVVGVVGPPVLAKLTADY